jgi:hypothetical protein
MYVGEADPCALVEHRHRALGRHVGSAAHGDHGDVPRPGSLHQVDLGRRQRDSLHLDPAARRLSRSQDRLAHTVHPTKVPSGNEIPPRMPLPELPGPVRLNSPPIAPTLPSLGLSLAVDHGCLRRLVDLPGGRSVCGRGDGPTRWSGSSVWCWRVGVAMSAGAGAWQRGEAGERGGEFCCPGPGFGDT